MASVYRGREREYHREYYYKRRAALMELVGDKCASCGSTESLEFDHIEPRLKSFDINDNMTASNSAVQQELKKCQMLCRECHIRKTAAEHREAGYTHGTRYAWMKIRCRCDECLAAKRSWNDARNMNRRVKSRGTRGEYGRQAEHGERLRYVRGCRCELCRAANAKKERERRAALRAASTPGNTTE